MESKACHSNGSGATVFEQWGIGHADEWIEFTVVYNHHSDIRTYRNRRNRRAGEMRVERERVLRGVLKEWVLKGNIAKAVEGPYNTGYHSNYYQLTLYPNYYPYYYHTIPVERNLIAMAAYL